jgi:NADH dehydrogenase
MQGATQAAKNIVRRELGQPTLPFVYRNLGNMAIVGRGSAIADLPGPILGVIGWLSWLFLHIFMLIGFRNRVVVLIEWAVAFLTFQRAADEADLP